MCQYIQDVTFHCGHQRKLWGGDSYFCLFAGEGSDQFHTAYISSIRNKDQCTRCKVRQEIKQRDKTLKRGEFDRAVESRYLETASAYHEAQAKKWESAAWTAQRKLTPPRIAELQVQIKERIVFFLEKPGLKINMKIELLQTILELPNVFDRRDLVTFYASYYLKVGDTVKKLEKSERNRLFATARCAGFERPLKKGLKLTEPVPLPVRKIQVVTSGAVPTMEDIEALIESVRREVEAQELAQSAGAWATMEDINDLIESVRREVEEQEQTEISVNSICG
ncbi:hypothetical protein F5Y03DRAFT_405668 [Xylaria venustula]|nr:hypothetical protein F5Y03DRAFT_405668 [Xylaria venustula]